MVGWCVVGEASVGGKGYLLRHIYTWEIMDVQWGT